MIATSSLAVDTSKMYAGAGLAIESASNMDSGMALVLNAGLPIIESDEVAPGTLAVEGEFTYSVVSPSWDYSGTPYYTGYPDYRLSYTAGGTYDLTVMTLAGYAVYIFDIDEQFYVRPRIGLIYRSYDLDGVTDKSELGIAVGLGGGYRVDRQIDIYLDYTLIDGSDLTHLTAGAVFHF